MSTVVLVGCGFVADLYMASLATFPSIRVAGAFDRDPTRQVAFAKHWNTPVFDNLQEALDTLPSDGLLLNLTNPASHGEINFAALDAGKHVFCEKPLSLNLTEAQKLVALAKSNGVQIASAPSSVLGEAAQLLIKAVSENVAGAPRLVYAELDDGFIPQAPIENWRSVSGAPWPYKDEFQVGCTLEHAGYYLSWLIAMFGSVVRIVAASTETLPDKRGISGSPDFSVATLFFETGTVARLTCSIAAPHDHRIRVIGDKGVLEVKEAWDNTAAVKFHRRFNIRRRLIEHPFGKRLKVTGISHPKVKRSGAAAMNFALGPAEMLGAIATNQPSRLANNFALHLTEVTLAIHNADKTCASVIQSRCEPMEPMPWV